MLGPNPKTKRLAGAFLLLLLLGIVVLGIRFSSADNLPVASWGAWLQAAGATGAILFLLAGILATSIGLPRQLMAFIGGLSYGVGVGLLLSLLAALCGCALTATVSRRYFAQFIGERFPKPIAALNRLLTGDLFLKILILRLQPLGTNLLTNVCIGFTSTSLKVFMLASAVGYVPQMLVFSLLGAGVRVGSQTQLTLSIVLLLVSIGLGAFLYKRNVDLKQ